MSFSQHRGFAREGSCNVVDMLFCVKTKCRFENHLDLTGDAVGFAVDFSYVNSLSAKEKLDEPLNSS